VTISNTAADARATDETLVAQGAAEGLGVSLVAAVRLGDETVSSSRIRQCLVAGELDLANAMLHRPYEAEGVIIGGRRLGRTLGFPTVNVAWEPELKPAYGVYAVEVIFQGEALPAVANYGQRPTVESRTGHSPARSPRAPRRGPDHR